MKIQSQRSKHVFILRKLKMAFRRASPTNTFNEVFAAKNFAITSLKREQYNKCVLKKSGSAHACVNQRLFTWAVNEMSWFSIFKSLFWGHSDLSKEIHMPGLRF